MKPKSHNYPRIFFQILLILLFVAVSCSKKEEGTAPTAEPAKPADEPEAVVLFLIGDVQLEGKKVSLGDRISIGEVLITGVKATADIQIIGESQTVIRVKENTNFELKKFMEAGVMVHQASLNKGSALFTVNKQQKNEAFQVRTPTLVAGVRGTQFAIQSGDTGNSKIEVIDGSVAVKPRIEVAEALGDEGLSQLGIQNPVSEVVIEKGKSSEVTPKDIEKIEKASGIAEIKKLPEIKAMTEAFQKSDNPEEKRAQAKVDLVAIVKKPEIQEIVKEKEKAPPPKAFEITVKAVPQTEIQKQVQEFQELIAVEQKKIEKQTDSKALVQERNKAMEKVLMARIQKITKKSIEKLILKDGREVEGVIFQDDDNYYVITPLGTETFPETQVEGLGF